MSLRSVLSFSLSAFRLWICAKIASAVFDVDDVGGTTGGRGWRRRSGACATRRARSEVEIRHSSPVNATASLGSTGAPSEVSLGSTRELRRASRRCVGKRQARGGGAWRGAVGRGGEAAGRNRGVPCASRSSSATERVNTRARRAVTRPREPPLARTTARDARPEPAEARGARTARPEPAAETHDMAVRLLLGGRGYTCVPRVRGCGASAGRAGCAPVECDAHHAAVFLISARRWRNEGPPTPVAKSAGQLSRTTFEFECRLNRKQSRKTARTAAISRLARRVSQEQDFRTDFRTIEPPRSGDLSTGDAPNLQPFRVATVESAGPTDTVNARVSRIEARGASSRERASSSRDVRAAHRASRRGFARRFHQLFRAPRGSLSGLRDAPRECRT